MTQYSPQVKDPQVQAELQRIAQIITSLGEHVWVEEFAEPSKPRQGMVRYADGTTWNPGSGAGMYLYNGATWNFLQGAGGSGETNTGSNQGLDGQGVFDNKVGVDLQFRHIAPASTKISVALNGKDIDLDVVQSNLSIGIGQISGFVDNSTNWDTAYSWGNHASGGYLAALTPWTANIDAAGFDLLDVGTLKIESPNTLRSLDWQQQNSGDVYVTGNGYTGSGGSWWLYQVGQIGIYDRDFAGASPPLASETPAAQWSMWNGADEPIGRWGFNNSSTLVLENFHHSGLTSLTNEDAAGTTITHYAADPDGPTTALGNFVFGIDQVIGVGQDNYVLTYDNSAGQISLEASTGGGTDFLTITEFDDTDATYYFYGGLDVVLDWKINRYHKTTFVKTSADEVSNPTKTSLALAWTDRLTLTYA